jgi:carboxypeptidase Q
MKPILRCAFLIAIASSSIAGTTSDYQRIVDAALQNQNAYEQLSYLTDHYGARISGSDNLKAAIEWGVGQMTNAGLSNVAKQKVMVPVWQRGQESAHMLKPSHRAIAMLGLGASIATPKGGISAPVEVITSFEQLSDKVKGKIVLFNVPFTTYYETNRFRTQGASEAAKHGAVASLVRSVTPVSLRSPHTGNMRAAASIPAAAISLEDADLIARLRQKGEEVVVNLEMSAQMLPEAESANVVGEIPGQTDEVVLIGGHIDSWDVGQGAQDDGGGCLVALEAARIIHKLGLKPKRTIRVVWFTNEENGLRGAEAYAEHYKSSLSKHVAAIENDSGMDKPLGLEVQLPKSVNAKTYLNTLHKMAAPLKSLGKFSFVKGHGGADLIPLAEAGITTMSLNTDEKTYFSVHHSEADTFDKIDKKNLNQHIALMAVMAYALANQ